MTIRDYQNHQFHLENWFTWSSLFLGFLCVLTLNFQSLYLGSMSYQYRHHDTPFQIARLFSQFEYAPLINGLEHKLNYYKRTCTRVYPVLFALLVALQLLVGSKFILWQIFLNHQAQYIASFIYGLLVLILISAACASSIFISARKRQIELMELALFWIKAASNLRYVA
ncbi:MAG: hypothetical protein AAFO95_06655 [Cyanobacteria bacterium J06600_6]